MAKPMRSATHGLSFVASITVCRNVAVFCVVLALLAAVDGQSCNPCGKDCCSAGESCDSNFNGGTCYTQDDIVECNFFSYCLKPTICCESYFCCPENHHCCGSFFCCPFGTRCYGSRLCIKDDSNTTVSSTTLAPRTTRPATAYPSTIRPTSTTRPVTTRPTTSTTRPVTTRPTTKRPLTTQSSRKSASSYDDDKPQVWYYIVAAIGVVLLVSVIITIICVKRRSMDRQGKVIARSGAPSLPYGTPLAIQSASPTSGQPATQYTKPQSGINGTTNRQSHVYVDSKLSTAGYTPRAVNNNIYYTNASSGLKGQSKLGATATPGAAVNVSSTKLAVLPNTNAPVQIPSGGNSAYCITASNGITGYSQSGTSLNNPPMNVSKGSQGNHLHVHAQSTRNSKHSSLGAM